MLSSRRLNDEMRKLCVARNLKMSRLSVRFAAKPDKTSSLVCNFGSPHVLILAEPGRKLPGQPVQGDLFFSVKPNK